MVKQIKQLDEKITSVVYHATDLVSASRIMGEKRFKLAPFMASDYEDKMKKNKLYYMSTSRGKTGQYTLQSINKIGVVFVLNGEWFNDRYKGTAVDYWERDWIDMRQDGDDEAFSEMEDRIYSDTPYIDMKNMSDAISAIHILYQDPSFDSKYLPLLASHGLKNKIPVYLYTDRNAFLVQDKRKIIPLKNWLKFSDNPIKRSLQRPRSLALDPYKELLHKKSASELSDKAKQVLSGILNNPEDAETEIKFTIRDMKSHNLDKLDGFLQALKKNKISNLKQFTSWIRDKWGT